MFVIDFDTLYSGSAAICFAYGEIIYGYIGAFRPNLHLKFEYFRRYGVSVDSIQRGGI